MAAQSKAQFLNEIHALLKKRYKPKPERTSRLSVLEAVVYGLSHEGSTREQANQALSRFKDGFFDWNEVRVSTIEEVQGALAGLPDAEPRAQKIRRFLRQLFEKTYAFSLEPLAKKPLKESIKALSEYEAFQDDYVEASVTQLALGGHAIPVDGPARRVMERLGVADPRIRAVTVLRVEVSSDLRVATAFVSVMGTEAEQRTAMVGLGSATGFLQARVAKRLQTRFTPVLSFKSDDSVKKSVQMSRLIDETLAAAAVADAAVSPATDDGPGEDRAGDTVETEDDSGEGDDSAPRHPTVDR